MAGMIQWRGWLSGRIVFLYSFQMYSWELQTAQGGPATCQ